MNYSFINVSEKKTGSNRLQPESSCPHESCLMSSFRGLRNGLYYGAKIRFVHSLVMTFLFRNDTFINKIKSILQLTYQHSRNLGFYVFIYKSVCCILRRLLKNNSAKIIPFIAGIVGALFMWSTNTPVNQQIMLYLLSRNLLASTSFVQNQIYSIVPEGKGFLVSSVLCWGVVMFLFENFPKSLQSSLFSSMDFIYNESNFYDSWKDFVPFYIPTNLFN